jgi:hypothetical protein
MLQLLRTTQVLRAVMGLGAAAVALAATLPIAEAQPAASHATPCFYTTQIMSTRLSGDTRALYIRTSGRGYYRLDFASDCNHSGNEPLVIHPFTNSGQICSAISVDVSVRDTHERCLATQLTLLTPDEVAQIPKKDLP